MSDCSKHKKEILGISDMKVLAEMIGDLHYETLSELLWELQIKFHNDSLNDLSAKKLKLSHSLQRASKWIYEASNDIENAWIISRPYMENKNQ